tara:strand:+ start:3376 stop:4314 length:939 start_codon:yes stop_codon:yes gene_type:complete
MELITYSLNEFEKILWGNKNISLPQETIDYIEKITNEVSSPSYQKTPVFTSNDKNNFKKKRFTKDSYSSENSSGNFKATIINKKTGLDKKISTIKLHLNKITDKTFDTCRDELIIIINELINEDKIEEKEFMKVGEEIFSIATTNSFYSSLYAKLYNNLIKEFDFLENIFDKNYKSYLTYFEDIKYINPTENYDEFCNITLQNENRMAYSKFLTNCLKEKIIDNDKIIHLIDLLFLLQSKYINTANNSEILVEIIKNISIFLIDCNVLLQKDEKYSKFINIIRENLELKPLDTNSITNKIRFKYMDILDAIK